MVIDDYFAVSCEDVGGHVEAAASVRCLERAEEIYSQAGVFGSPEKIIRGEENFKVVGAEVFSDHFARSAGVVTVSAPASKRIPMIALSLSLSLALSLSLCLSEISLLAHHLASSGFQVGRELGLHFHVPASLQLYVV